MGVSGGGGDPRWARTVDVEAVELIRLIEEGSLILSRLRASAAEEAPSGGGGQYGC
jgi:hypothetical protein